MMAGRPPTDSADEERELAAKYAVLGAALGGCLFLGGIAGLITYVNWNCLMESGPHHGTPLDRCPSTAPDHEFRVNDRFVLRVHDDSADDTAVVSLRDRDTLRWCIRANGWNADVNPSPRSLRFQEVKSMPGGPYRVFGRGRTLNGTATWWFISREGDLLEYFYPGLN